MIRPLLIGATCAFLASATIATSNTAIEFARLNWKQPSSPARNVAPGQGSRAAIQQANERAAARHGVPLAFMDRLTMRESGYRFVKGPPTRWGRAHGPWQMLCDTAKGLGEHDCNRLMHDAERGADLAARYVRMGYELTGSWHGAAAVYHGGENRRLWGRKTQAYASAVGGKQDRPFPKTVNAYAPPIGSFGASIMPAAFVPANYGRAI